MIFKRRIQHVCLLFGVLYILPQVYGSMAGAQETADRAAALEERVDDLRRGGEYVAALESARELLALLQQDDEVKAHEMIDAEWLVATLERIVRFSDEQKDEYAAAQDLGEEFEQSWHAGRFDEATSAMRSRAGIFRRLFGEEHPKVAGVLDYLGVLQTFIGDDADGESILREALAIRRKAQGPEHPDVGRTLKGLGRMLDSRGDYAEAQSSLHEALVILRRALGPEHHEVASVLDCLAANLENQGDYGGAEAIYREALAVQREVLGSDHPDVAAILINLAKMRYSASDPDGARRLCHEAMGFDRNAIGPERPTVAINLHDLGGLLKDLGDYAGAERLYREAAEAWREAVGPVHPLLAVSLADLGLLRRAQGDNSEAELLLRQALAIRRRALGPEDPEVAKNLYSLGETLHDQGDIGGAEKCYREGLAIVRAVFGDHHPGVSAGLNNLGLVQADQGDYESAEALLSEALAIEIDVSGPEDPAVATGLNNLGMLHMLQGDYAGAEPLLREALAIRRNVLGPNDLDFAQSLNNLGELLRLQEDFAAAEQYYREALDIRRGMLNPAHQDVARTLHNLGMLQEDRGDYAGAEPLLREAAAILSEACGSNHFEVGTILQNLGLVLINQGDFGSAEAPLREALAVSRAARGLDHPGCTATLITLARLCHALEDYTEAEALLTEASRVHDAARLRVGSGLKRAAFAEAPHQHLAAARLAVGNDVDAWPAVEKAQGRALTDILLAADQRELSPLEIAREDSLQRIKANLESQLEYFQELARNEATELANQRAVEVQRSLFATQGALVACRREIAANHPVTEGENYPLERVQAALSERTALIGWLDVCWQREQDCESWCYVVRSTGPVQWARIEPVVKGADDPSADEDPIERAVLMARDLTLVPLSGSTDEVSQRGRALWAERIGPVIQALEGVEALIVIPSGALTGIPIETFVDPNGVTLGDRFLVSYIPSATIHTWLFEHAKKHDTRPPSPFLLVGDPAFSPEPAMAAVPGRLDPSLMRSVLAGNTVARSRLGEARLPHTRNEINNIRSVCPQAKVLLGADASEQTLVGLAESGELAEFDVIHIATHAFADITRAERSALILSQVNLPDPRKAALSGARVYDGLVTVKEILQEWELDADLVTLSACQTGLGTPVYSEGLVGFSHAFLQRGARSLLVSQWSAHDEATSLLMCRFYQNILGEYTDERAERTGEPMSKVEALQEAKRYLRTYTDDWGNRPYEHPYFWAGFVLIGERD